jgi:hypothetical protein
VQAISASTSSESHTHRTHSSHFNLASPPDYRGCPARIAELCASIRRPCIFTLWNLCPMSCCCDGEENIQMRIFFLRNMQYLYPCPRRSQPAWPAGCWANAVDLINEPKMPSDKPLRLPQDPSCCKKMQQLQLWSRKTLPNGPLIPLIKYLKGVSSNMLHKFTFNHQFNRWEMSK